MVIGLQFGDFLYKYMMEQNMVASKVRIRSWDYEYSHKSWRIFVMLPHRICWWASLALIESRVCSNDFWGNRLSYFHVNKVWSTLTFFFIISNLPTMSPTEMNIFELAHLTASSKLIDNIFKWRQETSTMVTYFVERPLMMMSVDI